MLIICSTSWMAMRPSVRILQTTEAFVSHIRLIRGMSKNTVNNNDCRISTNTHPNNNFSSLMRMWVKFENCFEIIWLLSNLKTWCTKYRTEYLKEMIQYNPHSPAKYRVNLPLANFQTFSDVYKCSANSQMNRKNKCVMWWKSLIIFNILY